MADTTQTNKYLGILATVEEGGTITVPLQFLEGAGISVGAQVEIFGTHDTVFFRTTESTCDLCGGNANTKPIGNLKVCSNCINDLTTAAEPTTETPPTQGA